MRPTCWCLCSVPRLLHAVRCVLCNCLNKTNEIHLHFHVTPHLWQSPLYFYLPWNHKKYYTVYNIIILKKITLEYTCVWMIFIRFVLKQFYRSIGEKIPLLINKIRITIAWVTINRIQVTIAGEGSWEIQVSIIEYLVSKKIRSLEIVFVEVIGHLFFGAARICFV